MEFTDGPDPSVNKHKQHQILRSILIALVYLISFALLDLVTKQFESLPGIVTWYPPAGLTCALLLVFGVRFTPAVIVALFFSSVFIYRIPQSSFQLLLWSCVVSFIYSAAAWFLRHRIHLDWKLRKLRDVVWLVLTVVLVSAFLAILSISSSALGSEIPRNEFLRAIYHWWIGEAVGVLTVTPFLLVYVMPWLKRFVDGQPVHVPKHFSFPGSALTFIGQAASLVLILYWVFGTRVLDEFRPLFLLALPLIWIALDRGFKILTMAIMVLNFGVVLSIWLFGFDVARLAELELLMIVICIVGFLMGAVVTERKQAEQEIANLAVFPFENPNIILRLNRDGIVLFANPASDALLRMWGCTLGGLAPQFWRDLASQVLASKKNKTLDIECEGKFIELFIVPVTTPDYVNLYGRDITERKHAQDLLLDSESRFRTIFDRNLDGILIADIETRRFLMGNSTIFKMLGYTQDEMSTMNVDDIHPPEDLPYVLEQFRRLVSGEIALASSLPVKRKDGSVFYAHISATSVTLSAHTYIMGIFHDITERKRAEEEIFTQLDELQRWQTATLGRENRILELKHEVNELLAETNQVPRYPSAESPGEQE